VRAQAELGTVGFTVVRCAEGACDESSAVARLSVTEQDGRLLLRASRQETLTLTQELDMSEREISPEVAAIRAVELLRAVLLLAIREGSRRANEGSAVREFTSFDEPGAEPAPPPPPPAETPRQVTVPPSPPRSHWTWSLGVGPSISVPALGVSPGFGGEFYLDAVYRFFYVGGAVDAALLPSALDRPEGRTRITSLTAALRAGIAIPCRFKWSCHVGGAFGVLQYDLQAEDSVSFTGTDERHLSVYAGGDATLTRYFGKGVGMFLRLRVGSAADAAFLNVERAVLLGRPALGASLGVALR
jgi:hypothetical protein